MYTPTGVVAPECVYLSFRSTAYTYVVGSVCVLISSNNKSFVGRIVCVGV